MAELGGNREERRCLKLLNYGTLILVSDYSVEFRVPPLPHGIHAAKPLCASLLCLIRQLHLRSRSKFRLRVAQAP